VAGGVLYYYVEPVSALKGNGVIVERDIFTYSVDSFGCDIRNRSHLRRRLHSLAHIVPPPPTQPL
jgi:hypothetical protein